RFARPRWFVQGDLRTCLRYLIAKRQGVSREATRLWYRLSVEARFHPGDRSADGRDGWHARISDRLFRTRVALRRSLGLARVRRAVRRLLLLLAPIGVTPARVQVLLSPSQLAGVIRYRLAGRERLDALAGGPGTQPLDSGATPPVPDASMRANQARLHHDEVSARWRREFPDRDDDFSREDVAAYTWPSDLWDAVFDQYDIIQAYSTDPIRPLLAGCRYFAFEHGTLRHLPLQRDVEGRVTCLGYRFAEHVFVTNLDCHQNAGWLAPGRFSLINHPMDEDQALSILGHERLRAELCQALDSDALLFFPTRHDWVPGTGYADKANDLFLDAFVQLRKEGRRIGLILCEWGANVEQSKALLSRSGFASHVQWTPPMAIVRFLRTCRASDCVVDQFKLGAMGGISVRAMMAGVPVISYLDEREVLRHYPEMPPIVNCRSTEEIVDRIRDLLDQPEERAHLGADSRAWIDRYHAKRTALNTQVRRYRDFLDGGGHDPGSSVASRSPSR
ncbi:MAG: glycosyltransferase, partial [Burkholderiales bacterium]|nr:glycosyltransferase [Burkholderiales bacterium]